MNSETKKLRDEMMTPEQVLRDETVDDFVRELTRADGTGLNYHASNMGWALYKGFTKGFDAGHAQAAKDMVPKSVVDKLVETLDFVSAYLDRNQTTEVENTAALMLIHRLAMYNAARGEI